MKTITLDADTYKSELNDAYDRGNYKAFKEITEFLDSREWFYDWFYERNDCSYDIPERWKLILKIFCREGEIEPQEIVRNKSLK